MHTRSITVIALLCVAASSALGAERTQFSVAAELRDAYVWRGQVLTDGAVLQPGLTATRGGFSAGIWGNLILDGTEGDTAQFSEVDYAVSYAFVTRAVGMAVGLTSYTFPNASTGNTTEAHISAEFSGLPLSTGLSLHYDLDEADGIYAMASVGKTFDVNRSVALGVGFTTGWASSGYNAYYFGLDDSRANDGNLLVEGIFTVGGDIGLRLGVQYSWLWDSEIESGARSLYADDSNVGLVFGVNHEF